MTKKRLQLLGRVRDARKRLRDAAAGGLAAAEAEHSQATERHQTATDDLVAMDDGASARLLSTVGTSRDLWVMELERRVAVEQLGAAEKAARLTLEASDRQRAELRGRARELRVTEKVIDRTRAAIASYEKKAEQKSNDDLASRPRRTDED